MILLLIITVLANCAEPEQDVKTIPLLKDLALKYIESNTRESSEIQRQIFDNQKKYEQLIHMIKSGNLDATFQGQSSMILDLQENIKQNAKDLERIKKDKFCKLINSPDCSSFLSSQYTPSLLNPYKFTHVLHSLNAQIKIASDSISTDFVMNNRYITWFRYPNIGNTSLLIYDKKRQRYSEFPVSNIYTRRFSSKPIMHQAGRSLLHPEKPILIRFIELEGKRYQDAQHRLEVYDIENHMIIDTKNIELEIPLANGLRSRISYAYGKIIEDKVLIRVVNVTGETGYCMYDIPTKKLTRLTNTDQNELIALTQDTATAIWYNGQKKELIAKQINPESNGENLAVHTNVEYESDHKAFTVKDTLVFYDDKLQKIQSWNIKENKIDVLQTTSSAKSFLEKSMPINNQFHILSKAEHEKLTLLTQLTKITNQPILAHPCLINFNIPHKKYIYFNK